MSVQKIRAICAYMTWSTHSFTWLDRMRFVADDLETRIV